MKYLSKSSEKTKKIGENLAKQILKKPKTKAGAFVILLSGDLGGGKTTFVQGFAAGLGVKEKILSPTFVICKKFQIPNPKAQASPKSQKIKAKMRYKNFYHIDCYRAGNSRDMGALGMGEIISNPENIVVVEWPEKAEGVDFSNAAKINFSFAGENIREIFIGR